MNNPYMLLDSLLSDCRYCLGPAQSLKHLRCGGVSNQFKEIRKLYAETKKNGGIPEWTTIEQIDQLESDLESLEKRLGKE